MHLYVAQLGIVACHSVKSALELPSSLILMSFTWQDLQRVTCEKLELAGHVSSLQEEVERGREELLHTRDQMDRLQQATGSTIQNQNLFKPSFSASGRRFPLPLSQSLWTWYKIRTAGSAAWWVNRGANINFFTVNICVNYFKKIWFLIISCKKHFIQRNLNWHH